MNILIEENKKPMTNPEISCPLCKLVLGDIEAKCYFFTDLIIVVDYLTCGKNSPMVVSIVHKEKFNSVEEKEIEKQCKDFFGKDITFEKNGRQIKDHANWCVLLR